MGFSRQEYWSGVPLPSQDKSRGCIKKQRHHFADKGPVYSNLEKAMAPHSSTLAWKIPWMKEPGGLQSMGSLESDATERLHFHFHALEKEMATHSSVLAWRIPGTAEPGGLPSVGLAQSRTRLKRLSSSRG